MNLAGESAAGVPVTVRLEPCGAAKARLIDRGGKPVAGRLPVGSSKLSSPPVHPKVWQKIKPDSSLLTMAPSTSLTP